MQSEFDDHIKKQVDGFKLSPSPQIWDLVEAQLPEKKRRRFIFWWLPLGVIIIGFGVYEMVGYKKNDKQFADNKTNIQINKNGIKDSVNNLAELNKTNKILDKKLNTKNLNNKTVHNLNKDKSSNSKIIAGKLNVKKESILNNKGGGLNKELKNEDLASGDNEDKKIIFEYEINKIIKDSEILKENLDTQSKNKLTDSTTIDLAKKGIKTEGKDTGLIKAKGALIKTNSTKVKWEIIADIGAANTVGSALSNNNSSQYFSSPSNTITTPGNSTVQSILSTPTSGFSIGINLQRTAQITDKLAWYGSLGYGFISNHQASGALVDSSKIIGGDSAQFYSSNNKTIDKVANYYKYGNTLNHTNSVHLFNVSIGLKYNVGKHFSLYGGAVLGYQFYSHWLQPDATQSILYYSNKLTNEWNIGTKIGFDWNFGKQFSIGAFYNYSFSKASLAAVQQSLHWQTVGATFSIQLPFKK